ncbi:murein transglycosylase [Lysobacter arseniciresistens ZS79]|uniref:Murein transglycosylase n=1 Tax=Lysobacter arseniciresistens ZS79 TaxID=913325 RepID=A0A0A0F1Y8_9GAMM|nr:murein transglycosylase [Lysobacter arseniciresistens ZS79]
MSRSLAPLLVLLLAAVSADAAAQSRRDRAATEALQQRMQEAETRYREAIVAIGNHDPEGAAHADAALEDMEDVVTACVGQRGCSVTTMLTTYERLLKLGADIEGGEGLEEEDPDAESHHAAAIARDVPEAARAAALLGDEHDFDHMVQYNPAVQEGIRRWLTDMRDEFLTSHENYQYLRRLMWPQYQRAGLPEALLFGILAKESNGRVHSTSRAGASGPMQFMYATGRRFGLGEDGTGFDTRYDPYAASAASVAYLNERMGELNRNIELALAAYNGGEGRARRVHRANPGKSFWHVDVYNEFPPETRDYVPMVIAAAWLFLHPDEYGLSLPKVDARPAKLQLQQPASIYQLTICLGNRGVRDGYMRALRNLNPRYRADDMLPAGAVLDATPKIAGLYRRHCVDGSRARLARELVASDPSRAIVRGGPDAPVVVAAAVPAPVQTAAPATYRVQRGETLSSIARKFECRATELAQANGIRGPRYTIRPGQQIELAGCAN